MLNDLLGTHPIILFDYSPTRSGEVPSELLEGFKGTLQVDGYDGYAPVCKRINSISAGCMAHCRRNFHKASKTNNGKGVGKKGLNIINKLYKIERQLEGRPPGEKLRVRLSKSRPIMDALWPPNWSGDI